MIELLWIVISGVFVGTMSAWTLTLLRKWGVIEWLQANAKSKLFYELVCCYYCMSWWMSLALSTIVALVFGDGWLLFGAFTATMVSVKLVS